MKYVILIFLNIGFWIPSQAMKRKHSDQIEIARREVADIRFREHNDYITTCSLIDMIYEGQNLNKPNIDNDKPFLIYLTDFCQDAYAPFIPKATRAGADPNVVWKMETPLEIAIDKTKPRMVYALLKCGANPNLISKSSYYPLRVRSYCPLSRSLRLCIHASNATFEQKLKIVRSLLFFGANPNALYRCDSKATNALKYVVEWYCNRAKKETKETCRLLIRYGTHIDNEVWDWFDTDPDLKNEYRRWLLKNMARQAVPSQVFPKEMIEKIMEYIK